MGDEELNDVDISVTGGPLHGCCNEVTAESVDLSALFEEVAACRELRVDGCPVKGGDVLRVSVGCQGSARLDEVSDNVYFSTLRGYEDVYLEAWVRRQSGGDKWAGRKKYLGIVDRLGWCPEARRRRCYRVGGQRRGRGGGFRGDERRR